MFAYPHAALLTGLMLVIAGGLTLARHFLLEPLSTHYPKAPAWLRHTMFLFAAVLIYTGLRFVWAFATNAPDTIPPQPGPATQLLAVALLLYKSAMLANVLRQHNTAATWKRLNRLNEKCRTGGGKCRWPFRT